MYELLYIVPNPFTEKDLPEIAKKVNQVIENLEGKILKTDSLGNRKLAYPIKHNYRGFYQLSYFEIDPKNVQEVNQKLELMPEVLRQMIISVEKFYSPEKERKDTRLIKPKSSKEKLSGEKQEKAKKLEEKDGAEEEKKSKSEDILEEVSAKKDQKLEEKDGAKEEKKDKKESKISLKKLGEKMDELFKKI